MKLSKILLLGLVTSVSAIMACTDPDPPAGSTSSTGGSSSSSSTGGDFNGITGTAKDTYWSKAGDQLVYSADRWSKVEAIADKTYPGTISDTGDITIPDVPVGPYWLALTGVPLPNYPTAQVGRTFIETDAREIDLGRINSGRSDVAPMTQSSMISIDAMFATPLQVYAEDMNGQVLQSITDELQFVSRGAGLWGYPDIFGDGTGPVNGATQVQGWTFDMLGNFQNLMGRGTSLVDASKGDDFIVVHGVGTEEGDPMPDGNPWTGYQYFSAKSSASFDGVMMADGSSLNVSTTFKSLTQKNVTFDYKGSAFNALLPAGITDPVSLSLAVLMEAGAPNPAVGTFANLLSLSVGSEMAFTNPDPACQGAGCDPMACATTCDPGMMVHPGDYSHAFTYGNPFSYGQELFSAVVAYSKNVRMLLPEMTTERLRGYISISVPVGDIAGKPIVPTVSLPQNVKVGGQTTNFDQITPGVGTTPTISWEAPAIGKPTKYRVLVVDLTDVMGMDGSTSFRRSVALMETQSTQVTIPDGIMKSGTNYYFQVTAHVTDSYDSARPFVFAQRESSARTFTGVVTP